MVKLFVLVVVVAFAAALVVHAAEIAAVVYGVRWSLARLSRERGDRRARVARQTALRALGELQAPSTARGPVVPYGGVLNPESPAWFDNARHPWSGGRS